MSFIFDFFISISNVLKKYYQEGKDKNPLLRKLDNKLKSSQDSLCLKQSDCFSQVIEKKATTFLHVIKAHNLSHIFKRLHLYAFFECQFIKDKQSLLGLVSEDYRRTGRCNSAFAKEPFGMMGLAWAIAKNYSKYGAFQRG